MIDSSPNIYHNSFAATFPSLNIRPRGLHLENTVTIQSTPGAYDLSFASVSCTLSSGGSCMTDTPTYGFSFTVPEPSTWAMMLIGFVGLGYAGWRQSSKLRVATT